MTEADEYGPGGQFESGPQTEPGTALAVPDDRLPVPNVQTGELALPDDVDALGLAVQAAREKKRELDGFIRLAVDYIADASRVAGTKTLRGAAGVQVVLRTSDEIIVQDWIALRTALVKAGLPQTRIDALTKPKTTYSLDAAVEKQLRAANDKYGEILDRFVTRIAKAPSVTVSA